MNGSCLFTFHKKYIHNAAKLSSRVITITYCSCINYWYWIIDNFRYTFKVFTKISDSMERKDGSLAWRVNNIGSLVKRDSTSKLTNVSEGTWLIFERVSSECWIFNREEKGITKGGSGRTLLNDKVQKNNRF